MGKRWLEAWRDETREIMRAQRVERGEAMAGWLAELRPWNARCTLTFSGSFQGKPWLPSAQAAERRVQRYLDGLTKAVHRPVDGLAGIEYGGKLGRIHAEVLLYIQEPYKGCLHEATALWTGVEGNGHVGKSRPVKRDERRRDAEYVVKYVTKGGRLLVSRSIGPVTLLGKRFADPGMVSGPTAR